MEPKLSRYIQALPVIFVLPQLWRALPVHLSWQADWRPLCALRHLHPHPPHPHCGQQLRQLLQEQIVEERGEGNHCY